MNRNSILFAAAILFAGCSTSSLKPNQYRLSGTVEGYKDSTTLYFQIGRHQDSTYIVGNKFQFIDTLGTYPKEALLHIKNTEDYTTLWLEKGALTIALKKGDFKYGKTTGSKTQVLDEQLMAEVDSLNKDFDRINKAKNLSDAEMEKQMLDNEAKTNVIYAKFIAKHPASIVSINLLWGLATSIGRKKTRALYQLISPEMKATEQGKKTAQFLALNKDIEIGKPFVDFTQYNVDGKPVKLSDFKGHVVLLDFWASWCGPCREENPNQVKNYNLYKDKGFQIVGIAVDDSKKEWLAAVKKDGLPYINLGEKNGGENKAAVVYGINQFPTTYLIDKNGIIIAKDVRGKGLDSTLKAIYN